MNTPPCNCVDPDPSTCAACQAPPPAFELAKLLCHKLARITGAPAYVVDDDGHAMLACRDDIGEDGLHYWRPEQVIFTAPAPES